MNSPIDNMLNDCEYTIFVLHNIGEKINVNYNTPAEIGGAKGLLTFDGCYGNVWRHRHLLQDRPFILFVMGGYVGCDNAFDSKMPLEKMCDWFHLCDLISNYGGVLVWHTYLHRDLTRLNDVDLVREVTPPISMDYFAYPYSRFNERVIAAVRQAGFKYAFCAGKYGDGSLYQIRRKYL